MAWQQWVLVAFFALTGLLSVSLVGKPRTPSTPGVVVVGLIIDACLIGLVVSL